LFGVRVDGVDAVGVTLSSELSERFERARAFAASPEVAGALERAAADRDLFAGASWDPEAFLRSQGIAVPAGLAIWPLDAPDAGLTSPDRAWFSIRLYNRRTWLYRPEDGPPRTDAVCLGLEIVPRLIARR
jgi:hypothetical protein